MFKYAAAIGALLTISSGAANATQCTDGNCYMLKITLPADANGKVVKQTQFNYNGLAVCLNAAKLFSQEGGNVGCSLQPDYIPPADWYKYEN